jgi:hypothetical protein
MSQMVVCRYKLYNQIWGHDDDDDDDDGGIVMERKIYYHSGSLFW